jgi:hypothetical protein
MKLILQLDVAPGDFEKIVNGAALKINASLVVVEEDQTGADGNEGVTVTTAPTKKDCQPTLVVEDASSIIAYAKKGVVRLMFCQTKYSSSLGKQTWRSCHTNGSSTI